MRAFIAKYNILIIMIITCLMGTAYAEEGTNGAEDASGPVKLTWAGCGITKKAFMNELAAAYSLKTGVEIDIQGGGSTKGIRSTTAGKTDLGGSCRYKMTSHKSEQAAVMRPVAWDALVVLTHPDNPVTNITIRQLRDIFTGKITNWKQMGGKNAPIRTYARTKISGVGRTLRKLVFANYDQEVVAVKNDFRSSGKLEKAIEKDVNGFGVSGISSARKRNLKILTLEGKIPTYKNIVNGSYFLYRPLYMVINTKSKHIKIAEDFYAFAHSPVGKEILRDNGTVPYLDALSLVMKQVEQDERAAGRGVYRN